MTEGPTRKLAVLVHADVVGSTALVQIDETLAHQRIVDTFRRFAETIVAHGGIAHEIRGDALVAEFSKASDAVSASLAFQEANTTQNETLGDDVRPIVRVGIALGEVVVADNTITGEGIVLAQRLEQLAEPGGVCIQGAVYETVPKRLPFAYENLGNHELKGFVNPVNAYAVRPKHNTRVAMTESPSSDAAAVFDLSDKPSIAVLPFANMSGDPEQEYFSDGITGDIITELSRFRELFVIARNSSFTYKKKATPVQEMGATLGVKYVVEGSVRKAGARIRVTAQLVDSTTGHHLWADRYDRSLEDIFAVQDEITEIIVATVAGRLQEAQSITARRKPPRSMAAYDLLLRGKDVLNRARYDADAYTNAGIEEARQLFSRALELEPQYGLALAYLSATYLLEHSYGHEVDLAIPADCAEKAVAYSPDDSRSHSALSWVQLLQHSYQSAQAHALKATALNPNDTDAVHTLGCVLSAIGRHEEAMTWHQKAMRLNPFYPPGYDEERAYALYLLGRYEEAASAFEATDQRAHWVYAYLGACYAQLGRTDEAKAQTEKFLSMRPGGTSYRMKGSVPMGLLLLVETYKNPSDREHWYEGMRKAGLNV